MKSIKTYKELISWFEENHYFEDGHVSKIDMNPLVFTVGFTMKGNHKAYAENENLNFKIIPHNVFLYENPCNFEGCDQHCIESIEPFESDQGLGIKFNCIPTLTLIAESYTISHGEIVKSIVKPWLNNYKISVSFTMNEIPQPNFWKQEFKKSGFDIAFRFYSGESLPISLVPYPNYSAYFFQLEDRISVDHRGIYISYCSIENHIISMSFCMEDPELDSLWAALMSIVVHFPDVIVSCGNCTFTGLEWMDKLSKVS